MNTANVTLMEQTADFIEEEGTRFNQLVWGDTPNKKERNRFLDPICGTACCIAGAALYVNAGRERILFSTRYSHEAGQLIRDRAIYALELSRPAANNLFSSQWPKSWENPEEEKPLPLTNTAMEWYDPTFTPDAATAARVLRHIAKHGYT